VGWETLAIVGFQAISSAQGMGQAKKEAKAKAKEGELAAMNVADATVRAAGKLRTNFLQSGLTLEGGPMEVIAQAFAKGRTDISRIEANANAASKNLVSAARTKMLSGLAGSLATSAFSPDFSSSFGQFTDNAGAYMGLNPEYGPFGQNNYGPFQ
jgi:hypothetical protein